MDCLPKYDKLLKAISDCFFIKATILNINTTPNSVNIGKAVNDALTNDHQNNTQSFNRIPCSISFVTHL